MSRARIIQGVGLSSGRLRWARFQCLFRGHEKWSNADGAWFCMRCLRTHNIELRWVYEHFDPGADLSSLPRAFRIMMRTRSDQLAASRSGGRGDRVSSKLKFPPFSVP